MGLGALVGSEGGPDKVAGVLELYNKTVKASRHDGIHVNHQNALMTAGYCHESSKVVEERGTELVAWYMDQQRKRAQLVWGGVDPATVPPDYQGYYERDQHLAAGPHPGDPTPADVVKRGTNFCVGTPDDCIKFYESYEAMGVEQMFLLCAIGPAANEEVMNTIRLFGKYVIPHFKEKEKAQSAVV
jgi:alkanesulfonate monooxygenase SsuD/methylene tetrahydromethanopterin reductase-like flavin-dependent oxidoreductase (luciferase family)